MTGEEQPKGPAPIDPATIRFEPARPDQAETAAELIWATGYEIFGYNYGDKDLFVRAMVQSWPKPDSIFSHKATQAAYSDDQLIGIELSYTNKSIEERVPAHLAALAEALTEEEAALVNTRWPTIAPIVPEIPDGAYYLSNLAALPQAQGRGVGYRLLTNSFNRAKQDGFDWVLLDVCSRKPAVRFYQQVGMTPLVETRLPQLEEPFDVPMHIRMGMKLSDWQDNS
ncbi:MAG: GNAT family N-acetyltransferase [Alphaproteobacteria bacterium]